MSSKAESYFIRIYWTCFWDQLKLLYKINDIEDPYTMYFYSNKDFPK